MLLNIWSLRRDDVEFVYAMQKIIYLSVTVVGIAWYSCNFISMFCLRQFKVK